MPIFFIVSGILQTNKRPEGLKRQEIASFILRRTKQLLIPYFVFGGILILFFQMLHLVGGEPHTYKEQLFSLITLQGIESLWFLPCYWLAELTFLLVILRLPDYAKACFVILGMVILTLVLNFDLLKTGTGKFMLKILIGVIFMCIGSIAARLHLLEKMKLCHVLIGGIIGFLSAEYNGFVGISALRLQCVGLFFFNATILSFCILALFRLYEQRGSLKIIDYFGKNTLVVVCTNNIIIECLRLLDYKLASNFLLSSGLAGGIIMAIIVAGIEVIYISLCKNTKIGNLAMGKY